MRWVLPLAVMLVTGCNREPSFDERYAAADKTVRKKAAEIDSKLAGRERAAGEAEAPVAVSPRPADVTPRR